MIGQHALVAPPVSTQLTHPGSTVTRMPLEVEQLSNSSHPNSGVALVRPVPQQASPVRVSLNFTLFTTRVIYLFGIYSWLK